MPQVVPPLFRAAPTSSQSIVAPESVPFLSTILSNNSSDSDVERGQRQRHTDECSDEAVEPSARPSRAATAVTAAAATRASDDGPDYIPILYWPRRWQLPRISSLFSFLGVEKTSTTVLPSRRPALRKLFRLLLLSFMILGIFHFISLLCGLYLSFFPDELDWPESLNLGRIHNPQQHGPGHWPTDVTADIHPVGCHSHNDYWRKKPLFSALRAGCTGVEADVWLFDEELYVGHHTAALTAARTLRTLYVNPLVKILDRQNPHHELHPYLDTPRNGVFDTDPAQNLVLLIDFKSDGEALWPYVYRQLQPLREKKYLTYFNGSAVIEGPVVVVATGNAPFHRVVENAEYRDIFFDAPLDLMEKASSTTPLDIDDISAERELEMAAAAAAGLSKSTANGGQGNSGDAPRDPNAYSIRNSYYASVSFNRAVLGFPILWRNRLSRTHLERMRAQIKGAHARGLKVRYWSVPSWPVSLRNYLWRVLVREGVDYLNVDDLKHATRGKWGNYDLGKGQWMVVPPVINTPNLNPNPNPVFLVSDEAKCSEAVQMRDGDDDDDDDGDVSIDLDVHIDDTPPPLFLAVCRHLMRARAINLLDWNDKSINQ